ncbi:hypothetical protein [Halopelagius longus]|uniref:Uncharacterized protein n=1 Tax=Halopelagius longus TaxID=1236180 RepID=A0A1H0XUL5_9EURY|nr:hypothetical protein [Halopelagius longus]RDI72103.1 hypothetical protein DWB78_10475 [Halopelagius longus]SDQ06617.1 hypothetical protein SAMN05216278_0203 [Halopelagius longus]
MGTNRWERPTRRRLLASIGLAAAGVTAGCAAGSDVGGISDEKSSGGTLAVRVTNRTETEQTATVIVRDWDENVVDRVEEASVPPNAESELLRADYDGDWYSVEVRGDEWETSEWWEPELCRSYAFAMTLETVAGVPSVRTNDACSAATKD